MDDGDSTLARLGRLALFADLSRTQLEQVTHSFDEEVFEAGRRVLRQGLGGGNVYVVLEGEASIRQNGAEIRRLGPGDVFGEISALTGDPPSADVIAVGVLRCFVVPGGRLEELLLQHPRVMLRLLRQEAERLQTPGG